MNMTNQLEKSRLFLDKYRFAYDKKEECKTIDPFFYNDILNTLYQENILITEQLTPQIFQSIKNVCNRLNAPIESIKAFIDSSEILQASCLVTGTDETILRISSRLINLLDEEELEFIIGHELGHFLLNHGYVEHHGENQEVTLQDQMKSRYKEISSDRIGLLAAPSTKKAISAMLKLTTGLDDKHLRFDVSAFISQSNETENMHSQQAAFSSHPSSLVRCRALLWFSMTSSSKNKLEDVSEEEMKTLDSRIITDLEKYIDGPIIEMMEEALLDFKLWTAVKEVISDGIFDKNEQKIFEDIFGSEEKLKMINFFKAYKHSEIKEMINRNYDNAGQTVILYFPDSYKQKMNEIADEIIKKFHHAN
tara:strand:+ start:5691 stop:6782 length:1092 start_codon:yes stop_codon:yes gene_type:complete